MATTSPVYAPAQALLNNKAEVAYYHAQILGRTETDFKQLAQVLNGVTRDPASVEAAKAVLTAPPPEPEPPSAPPPPPPHRQTSR